MRKLAKKNIDVMVNDEKVTITIRRATLGDVKEAAVLMSSKADELLNSFNKDFNFETFISKDLADITSYVILPYTNLTEEQLDGMDIVDIVDLVKEMLEYNNVKVEKVMNFLKKLLTPDTQIQNKIAQNLNFGGIEIPSEKQ